RARASSTPVEWPRGGGQEERSARATWMASSHCSSASMVCFTCAFGPAGTAAGAGAAGGGVIDVRAAESGAAAGGSLGVDCDGATLMGIAAAGVLSFAGTASVDTAVAVAVAVSTGNGAAGTGGAATTAGAGAATGAAGGGMIGGASGSNSGP